MPPAVEQSSLGLDAPLPWPPVDVRPMVARSASRSPMGDERIVDPTWGGLRLLASVVGDDVRLRARGSDLTSRLPALAEALASLGLPGALLDGELLLPQLAPRSTEAHLSRASTPLARATFVVSDLLWLAGRSRMSEPLARRRQRLSRLVPSGHGIVVLQPAHGSRGLIEAVRLPGVAGVVAKRVDSPYLPGVRSRLWTLVRLADLRLQAGDDADAADPARSDDERRSDLVLLRTLAFDDLDGPDGPARSDGAA